jgi:hypothetical protein
MDHIMTIFDFNVFNANFDKDINRYEKNNKVRRNSIYKLEVIRCRETYEKLEEEYIPD